MKSKQDITRLVVDVEGDGACGARALLLSLWDYILHNEHAKNKFSNKPQVNRAYELFGLKEPSTGKTFVDLKTQLENMTPEVLESRLESRIEKVYQKANRMIFDQLRKLKKSKNGKEIRSLQKCLSEEFGLNANASKEEIIKTSERELENKKRYLGQASLNHVITEWLSADLKLRLIEKNTSKNFKPGKEGEFIYMWHDKNHFQAIMQTPESAQKARTALGQQQPSVEPESTGKGKISDIFNDLSKMFSKKSLFGKFLKVLPKLAEGISMLLKMFQKSGAGTKRDRVMDPPPPPFASQQQHQGHGPGQAHHQHHGPHHPHGHQGPQHHGHGSGPFQQGMGQGAGPPPPPPSHPAQGSPVAQGGGKPSDYKQRGAHGGPPRKTVLYQKNRRRQASHPSAGKGRQSDCARRRR